MHADGLTSCPCCTESPVSLDECNGSLSTTLSCPKCGFFYLIPGLVKGLVGGRNR